MPSPTLPALAPFVLAGAAFAILGGFALLFALVAIARRRPWRFVWRTLVGVVLVALGGLLAAIGFGLYGYRALTREEVAARVEVRPLGPQRFEATFFVPDRADMKYEIAGDAIYVDAHVLKWTPMANLIGLHTAYELDRVAGRFDDIAQEKSAERTVHSLVPERRVDLFNLRRQYAFLSPLFDAEYGSGTFVPVTGPATFEVRVSTTGLLMRKVEPEH
jgi:hypothetical protein